MKNIIDGLQKNGLVYRYDSKNDKLVICKQSKGHHGYLQFTSNKKTHKVHRAVYETFCGDIPEGYEIDHINTVRDDNRVENLRLVTRKENCNNLLTIKHFSEAKIGNTNTKGKTWSEFGEKFFEHFGIHKYENPRLYNKEQLWYMNHDNKCRWEI